MARLHARLNVATGHGSGHGTSVLQDISCARTLGNTHQQATAVAMAHQSCPVSMQCTLRLLNFQAISLSLTSLSSHVLLTARFTPFSSFLPSTHKTSFKFSDISLQLHYLVNVLVDIMVLLGQFMFLSSWSSFIFFVIFKQNNVRVPKCLSKYLYLKHQDIVREDVVRLIQNVFCSSIFLKDLKSTFVVMIH